MIVEVKTKEGWKEICTLQLIKDKVVIEPDNDVDFLTNVFFVDKFYTPEDGVKYLNVVAQKFSRSYAIRLIKESEDTWLNE